MPAIYWVEQLFLTLLTGLMLKVLEFNTNERISAREKDGLGILLAMNSMIFVAVLSRCTWRHHSYITT